MSKRTPTLKQAVLALIGKRLAETCVAIPASVQSYDTAKQVADVKPLVQAYRYVDGVRKAFSLPVIPHCPVKWPGGGGFFFAAPLAAGDQVLLVFSDRSLERWFSSGAEGEAGDERIHALKDAFVLPELRHGGRPIAGLSSSRAIMGKESGPQITFGATDVRLGADSATDAVLKGTSFQTALNTMLGALDTFLAAIVASDPTIAAAMALGGPTSPASVYAAARAAFAAAFSAALSTLVKVS